MNNGREIIIIPVDKRGVVDVSFLRRSISDSTTLVSIMLANNEIGTIEPIKTIANIVHEYGCIFHTDAVQAVGHIPINVKELGVDMLSASAHKFNGPRGIGFLYIRKGIEVKPFIDGGSQERGLRAGTENVAAIVAMAVALKNNCNYLELSAKKLNDLENRMLDGLRKSGVDFIVNGSDNKLPGNVSISIRGYEGEMLLHRLDLMGICVSTGSACDSVNTQISHVIKAIGVPDDYAKGTIRISLGKNNTEEEVDEIVRSISKIING